MVIIWQAILRACQDTVLKKESKQCTGGGKRKFERKEDSPADGLAAANEEKREQPAQSEILHAVTGTVKHPAKKQRN